MLFGNWEYDATNDNLIEYDAIINLFEQNGMEGEKYISCDVARFGSDKTVIMLWEGLHIKKIRSILKSAVNVVVDEIRAMQQANNVRLTNIIVDEDGVGGGVGGGDVVGGFVETELSAGLSPSPLQAEKVSTNPSTNTLRVFCMIFMILSPDCQRIGSFEPYH